MHEKIGHLNKHLVFVSALWLALTTAILCAILPAGLPLTKSIGSAFSPSTTIVALRGRAEQVRGVEKRFVKGNPERLTNLTLSTNHPVFIIPNLAAVAAPYIVQDRPAVAVTSVQPLPSAVTQQPYPRGPPIA